MNTTHAITVPAPGSSSNISHVEASPHDVSRELLAEVRKLSTDRAALVARMGTTPKNTPAYKALFEESLTLVARIEEIHSILHDIGPLTPRKETIVGMTAVRT